jgi:hypothetical protein
MNAKEQAVKIFAQHIALASTDGTAFRRTVMEQLKAETGCSHAAAATHYNNAKKLQGPIAGLGRAAVPKGVRKMGTKASKTIDAIPDDECFSVLELVENDGTFTVGRCQSFEMQGDASEKFDDKVSQWPNCTWVMIQGLGPAWSDTYKLAAGEREIKRHFVEKVAVTA